MLFGFIERLVKVARISACVAVVLLVAFLGARWSLAETSGKPASKQRPFRSNVAVEELAAFLTCLQDTGQTNALRRFYDYSNALRALHHSTDLDATTGILQRLRDGRTNEAIRWLELRLRSDAVGFAASYRGLPGALREKLSLTELGHARDYCKKYEVKSSDAHLAQGETDAFALLDEKPSR